MTKIFWVGRFFLYKLFLYKFNGIGYLGRPLFHRGLRNFYVKSGFGIYPGWRIEILRGDVSVGSNVRIGHNFFMNCGSQIIIGNNVTISANVFIGTTDYKIPADKKVPFAKWKAIEKPIHIGDNCFIGVGAVIMPGSKLGEGCIVGANTVKKGQYNQSVIISKSKVISRDR
jgi:acetyltransferase-like isoleucine patch superfamily enzyme